MKIGCIAMIHYQGGFLGLRCAKGRGLILPGGTYEPAKDRTYQATAIREAMEEVGVTPHDLRYVWHGPDGGEYTTFTFEASWHSGTPAKETNEGIPQVVHWADLFESRFEAYYRILYEVMGIGR